MQQAFNFYRYAHTAAELSRIKNPMMMDFGAGWGRIARLFLRDTPPKLELDMPVMEVSTHYYARPEGSHSKLTTWRDGFRILWTIVRLFRYERALAFFAAVGFASGITSGLHPDFCHVP
jgi:hypothetical protein